MVDKSGLRVRIHRGAREIGGNCVELRSGGKSLLLDMGMPLADVHPDRVVPGTLADLAAADPGDFLGVVVSHPHFDHYGLIAQVKPGAPVFMGEEADRILRTAVPFGPAGTRFVTVIHYQHRQQLNVGPFCITPYLVDHSAFDAYALLVEAGGRSLFYTGDLRAHGRKARLFQELLDHGPKHVDAMLMEGTTIGREGSNTPSLTEQELEMEIAKEIEGAAGLVLAWFSAQNIDRFVTFFKAARRNQRIFVMDMYLACILDAISSPSLPSPHGSDVRVFLPTNTKSKLAREGNLALVDSYYHRRIYPEELAARAEELVILFRPSMVPDLEDTNCLGGATLIYSLWPGYLEKDHSDIREWCRSHGIGFKILHTSGHADVATLQRLVDALTPKRLVPIHTFVPQRFSALFSNTCPAEDGQWWEV